MTSCFPPKRFANPLSGVLLLVFCVLQFRLLSTAQSSAARPGFDGPAELPRKFLGGCWLFSYRCASRRSGCAAYFVLAAHYRSQDSRPALWIQLQT
jgi:hypothetical protein